MDNIDRNVRAIRESHAQQHAFLHRFRGNYAIDAARNRVEDIAEIFANTRDVRLLRARLLSKDRLNDILDNNIEVIERLDTHVNVWKTFPQSDITAEVSDRRDAAQPFYIVGEASYTITERDIERASDHAKVLRCATGLDAYPVIAGVRLNPRLANSLKARIIYDAAEFPASDITSVVLWYELVEDELEPPDPC